MNTEQQDIGIEQQVTTPKPATKPNTKNPKHVAAGKLVAERTRLAREAQKKALAEANVIIEKNKAAKTANKEKLPPITEEREEPEPTEPAGSTFTTGQWITIVGIGVTLVTTYVRLEYIKALYKRYMVVQRPPQQQNQHQRQPPPPQQQQPP